MSCRQVYARISYIRQRGLVKLVSGGLAGLARKCRSGRNCDHPLNGRFTTIPWRLALALCPDSLAPETRLSTVGSARVAPGSKGGNSPIHAMGARSRATGI